ncbi:MAG TPA: hypothetical protein VJO53_10740 [Candidatus Acidoferrales bacterium]|nr:hypothetical protein [Candidatus Acidoferrales bacterium]
MPPSLLALIFSAMELHISFPQDAAANEQIMLRWLHLVFGVIWIGLLYFFNLVGNPTMKQLDAPVRGKVFPLMMSRAMWWFRWSALVTVIAGLRYFWQILAADARNAGNLSLAWHWMGWWLLVWLVAFALIYPFQLPHAGILDNPWLRSIAIAAIAIGASWAVLVLNASPQSSNAHLAISIGGGMGLLMLLNAWGIIWRAQKRLIAWTRASVEQGAPMPTEAAYLARWAFLASRAGFWISFPMLFFMGAADHFPFLSGIAN